MNTLDINTNYFGAITYCEEDVLHIRGGLFGFETYTQYLPISFHEEDDSMISLQCIENEELSFILMNPFTLLPTYNPIISSKDLKELGANDPSDISFYVISVIHDPVGDSTVNLKAPLAVNSMNRTAKQIILDQPDYTFRHKLSSIAKER